MWLNSDDLTLSSYFIIISDGGGGSSSGMRGRRSIDKREKQARYSQLLKMEHHVLVQYYRIPHNISGRTSVVLHTCTYVHVLF